MKFQHLPIGARFEFEGKRFTKTNPLVASEEGGGQRMIPRYAVLRGLDENMAKTADVKVSDLDVNAVLAAFTEFESAAVQLLHEVAGIGTEQLAHSKTALAEAGQKFRNKIA